MPGWLPERRPSPAGAQNIYPVPPRATPARNQPTAQTHRWWTFATSRLDVVPLTVQYRRSLLRTKSWRLPVAVADPIGKLRASVPNQAAIRLETHDGDRRILV